MKLYFKSLLSLAFCPTGEGGGVDNSCGSSTGSGVGGKTFGDETKHRVILAAQASILAKSETNNIKAAQLHGKAARANEKAAKEIKKDPNYAQTKGASELYLKHLQKAAEHGKMAKELSEKVLGGSAGTAKQRHQDAKLLTDKANSAMKQAIGSSQGVSFYAGGNYNVDARVKSYENAANLHAKAAEAHQLAGNDKKASTHSRVAENLKKQVDYYRGLKK